MFTVTYNLSKDDAILLSCRTTRLTGHSGVVNTETFDIISSLRGVPAMDAFLSTPILVELRGAGFDILRGTKDYVLRWPRVEKVYMDRDWKEGVSRKELKELAKKSISMAEECERERLADKLAVIDRIHWADGTVVPSFRLRENVKLECMVSKDERRYGVEMKYGLDVESILKKGLELKYGTNTERKERIDPEVNKRVCLGIKSQSPLNQSPQKRLQKCDDIEQLFSSAAILSMTKAHHAEISQSIPTAKYIDLINIAPEKENTLLSESLHNEYIVLVDRFHSSSVRKVLAMVKGASIFGGRWHVYNWKIVRCINGDADINWRNELLWTYVNGNVFLDSI
jgi:hypothetical protein